MQNSIRLSKNYEGLILAKKILKKVRVFYLYDSCIKSAKILGVKKVPGRQKSKCPRHLVKFFLMHAITNFINGAVIHYVALGDHHKVIHQGRFFLCLEKRAGVWSEKI